MSTALTIHSIFSSEMVSTEFTHDRRNPRHLHMRDGIVAVVLFPVVHDEAGTDTGG